MCIFNHFVFDMKETIMPNQSSNLLNNLDFFFCLRHDIMFYYSLTHDLLLTLFLDFYFFFFRNKCCVELVV